MSLPISLEIALAHIRRRKRQTLISILGVALGVAFFVGVNALMRGFQTYFVSQVIDVQPHIVVKDEFRRVTVQPALLRHDGGAVEIHGVKPRNELRGIKNARALEDGIAAIPGVAVAPTLRGAVQLRYGGRDLSTSVVGIEPEAERRVTNLERDLIAGSLDDLKRTANGLIVGATLAERLGASLGDTITVLGRSGQPTLMKIVGIFMTGVVSLDASESFALLKVAQTLQDRPNVVNQLRIRLADVSQAEPVARRIETAIGYRTESWEETNANVLGVFVLQNWIMYSVVGAILLVATFGIYTIVSTVVHEKVRDIAILKSLGFTEGEITRIFVVEGVVLGMLGASLGAALGYGLVEALALVRFDDIGGPKVPGRTGFVLARETWPYVAGAGFAMTAAAVAALLPARRAASLDPVQTLRGAA